MSSCQKNMASCLLVKKTCSSCLLVKKHVLHVFLPKNMFFMSSCLKKHVFMSSCQKKHVLHVFLSKKHVFMSTCQKNLFFMSSCQKNMASCQPCKYCTNGKKLLQNKNRLQRFKKPFLWCSAEQTAPMLNDSATFTVQQCHYQSVKVALLHGNSGTIRV